MITSIFTKAQTFKRVILIPKAVLSCLNSTICIRLSSSNFALKEIQPYLKIYFIRRFVITRSITLGYLIVLNLELANKWNEADE